MKLLLSVSALALLSAPALSAELNAVASFSILGDLVHQVGGDRVAVTSIIGANADSHIYAPKPSDAAAVAAADIFFINGLGFEGWMDRFVEATGYTGPLIVVSDGVVAHEIAGDEQEHEAHAGEPDAHGPTDPHAWQSLSNGVLYVRNIAKALCDIDVDGCTTYTANADAYAAQLTALDTKVRASVAAIPAAQRKVITTHDAFGYFGEAYGVTFLAPEGISTDAEPSAAAVARLITQIREEGVKALFIENMTDGRLVQQIASETDVALGGELYADALSAADGPAPTYLDMFKHNVGVLIPAMEGK